LTEGSYIEESKRLGYEFSEAREETEQFFIEEKVDKPQTEPDSQGLPPGFSTDEGEQQLPPGFTQ
jgi:hypothetical protein